MTRTLGLVLIMVSRTMTITMIKSSQRLIYWSSLTTIMDRILWHLFMVEWRTRDGRGSLRRELDGFEKF